MLAQKEEYLSHEPASVPAEMMEPPKEPLIRHELNTNLRNCLRAIFFLIAFGAMVVTLLGGRPTGAGERATQDRARPAEIAVAHRVDCCRPPRDARAAQYVFFA